MLEKIFPIKLHMLILQLEGYKYFRLLKWIKNNFFVRTIPLKRNLNPTFKVKVLYSLSIIWLILISILVFSLYQNFLYFFLTILILLTQPYLLLGLGLATLRPVEYFLKRKIKTKTKEKIAAFKNLKVIGITGSYGKSSTKEILFQMLKDDFEVLRTPESYNTILGISKVVDLELNARYQYFICEMGAYKRGEIKEICETVSPNCGIITGITQQHLERFGNLENIVKAKFELFDSIGDKNSCVFNLENDLIRKEIIKRSIKQVSGYGVARKTLAKATKISYSQGGSAFSLSINNKSFRVQTALFGESNIQNIVAAAALAYKLGVNSEVIVGKIAKLKQIPHRLSLYDLERATVVDNTYSTNPVGFREMLKTAKTLKGKKALVTPGLVELGNMEGIIHAELGKLSDLTFDKIVLVGKNSRTKYLSRAIRNKKKVEFIADDRSSYSNKVKDLSNIYDWIFLENDVTQNY